MRSFVGILVLVVGGVILADLIIHPQGVQALSQGVTGFAQTSYSALLGQVPRGKYQRAG